MAQPSRVNHYCTTADGVLCRVAYLGPDGMADLYMVDNNLTETIRLPVAELRRVPDPRNTRPPIEQMPAERPRCAWCDRLLKPRVENVYSQEPQLWLRRIVRRTFIRWRTVEGVFDTNRCAIRFAGASYRGGFRKVRKT